MKKVKPQNMFRSGLTLWVSLLITLALVVSTPAQTNLCIKTPDGVTGPPANPIDGVVFSEESSDLSTQVQADIGWSNAARYNLRSTMGGTMTGLLQLLRTSSHVYLSLVIDDPAPDLNETIVIEFATTSNHAEDWRFHIKLFDVALGSEGPNRTPHAITFWRGGPNPANTLTGWNNSGATAIDGSTVAWMASGIKFGFFHGRRTLEMKIPIEPNILSAGGNNAIFFPAGTSTFKMYVNALSTSTLLAVVQSTWPDNVGIPNDSGDFVLERNTPDYSLWGDVSFDPRPACTGVRILGSQIGVEAPPAPDEQSIQRRRFGTPTETLPANCAAEDNTTSTGPANIFFARPENTGTTAADDAHNVNVTFRMANWGIPPADASLWTKIGCMKEPPNCGTVANPLVGLTGTNPTAPADVNHSSSTTFNTTWAMTNLQSCFQAKGGNVAGTGHQCMVAELRSSDPTARFLNTSARRNMNFVPASKYEENAEISAAGYGPPPLGRAKHKFMITVQTSVSDYDSRRGSFCKTSKSKPPTTNALVAVPTALLYPDEYRCISGHTFPKGMDQAMTWVARGYRMTGDFIVINGTKYETTSFVGGFGYVAGHKGPVSEWKQTLGGAGLIMVGENVYTVEIPPEEVATVRTTIEAVEPGGTTQPPPGFKRWGLSLHAGASIPHGNFNTFFNPGPNAGVDLEYRINKNFSLEGIYTFHRFRGETIGLFTIPDLNLHQFSINGKVYGSSVPWRPFVNFGGGAYKFDPGNTRPGLNVGFGVQRDITPTFAIEGMYNFHNVFTSGSSTRFSTVQGGVRFRF